MQATTGFTQATQSLRLTDQRDAIASGHLRHPLSYHGTTSVDTLNRGFCASYIKKRIIERGQVEPDQPRTVNHRQKNTKLRPNF